MTNYSNLIKINKIAVSINNVKILQNLDLTINKGEIHVIMGRNGSGKSTLSKVIAGHPDYNVTTGAISFNGTNILFLEPEIRAHLGIFLAFQYPIEVSGVNNTDFLHLAYKSKTFNNQIKNINPIDFLNLITYKAKIINMDLTFLTRNVNEGFSGGEKKRNEILQMMLLNSSASFMDETDSGLDIDALKVIAKAVNLFLNKNKSVVFVTHHQKILDYIKPDYIHIMDNGEITKTGDFKLGLEIENRGYNL